MTRFLKWATLILVTGLIAFMISAVETYPNSRWVAASGDAATDAYYALRLWLGKLGAKPHRVLTLAELEDLPPSATLMLGDRRDSFIKPAHVDQLLGWSKRGGHLFIEAEQPDQNDLLLDALDIDREAIENAVKNNDLPLDVTHIKLGAYQFKVQFTPYQNLLTDRKDAQWTINDASGLRMLHLQYGRGRITVLSNFDFMVENALSRHDHADFLWQVLNQGGKPSPVWIAAFIEGETTWTWLSRSALPLIITALVLILTWLWHVAPRFGPIQPDPQPVRRRLGEHLAAVGRFWWQHGMQAWMLTQVREWVTRRLSQQYPALASLPTAQLITQLSERSHLTPSDIEAALHGQPKRSDAFLRCIQSLIRIHQSL
ncbi:DUF4350 domain-containing protein [Chitinivorax sp. B]|uniref:DUF4350 domain-containing protein n=1 Tax=Chitinivorax sp. B TaxID=2502235 RepID=UPI0010F49BF1|nr:DUF4350 domain-containing protein [Chitinivorax sp. B]